MSRALSLDPFQVEAARKYAKDYERARLDGYGRVAAAKSLRLARTNLTPAERACADQLAGVGRTLGQLSGLTGRSERDLARLFCAGLTKLSRHYEAASVLEHA